MLEEYTLEEPKQKGRSPDSLIQAIDRIERLEKENKQMKQKIYTVRESLYCIHNHLPDYETQKMIQNMINILKDEELENGNN